MEFLRADNPDPAAYAVRFITLCCGCQALVASASTNQLDAPHLLFVAAPQLVQRV